MSRGRRPERTCIGCRGAFPKDEVVRILAGPAGPVIDYREKLPGRAAYVCPRPDCIRAALAKGQLARSLRRPVPHLTEEEFLSMLTAAVREKLSSLLSMAVKAGRLVSGYSAVDDALRKGTVALLVFADDISDGTREKIELHAGGSVKRITLSTKSELGTMVGRELAGVAAIVEKGFADAVGMEAERLKVLLKH
jgi:predicted RNA-binding protein YlxR (DUF448 family)/ribosomal protein L30E